ncbi:receptor-like protein kinase BRI1-like 3 [Durio zibethinus]|uniref:non-specific serine/threonine protein kinase n=1 Tax=Durio zibethinus TaxID=66656 RepID=A0A6P5WNR7_DURZI|nr:receptor-like protein kinase BRI1-like 3 [Durio zibethinus]
MRNFSSVQKHWMHFFCSFIFIFLSACFSALEASNQYNLSLQQQNRSNEVMALLVFKQKSVDADPEGFLNDWRSESLSPCSRRGVFCSTYGKVSMLNFTYAGLIGHLHMDDLIVLESLQHLHLSGNSFFGNLFLNKASYPSCIIETLDLSFNNLSEPISETFLDSCDHLASLNLSHNSIPGGSFNFGTSLVELDLSSNLISDSSILDYSLSSCQNVKLLNLSHNKMSGKLGNLSSCENLSVLDLSYNMLSGDIPAVLFSDFSRSLKALDLSQNNLSGNFPILEFKNCDKLMTLNLSNNSLYGIGIPQSLANCQLLENLDVSHNSLHDKIPAALGNLGNLKHLNLAHNNLSGNIPSELGLTCGTLVEFDLSGNNLSGGFPETRLNLGNNQLSGNFLSEVISTLPSLQILQVPFNNISGSIPFSLRNCAQLQVLDLSSNAFTGNIPSGLCSTFPSSLQRLLLADNFLSGTIPSDIGNCKNLKTINFARNHLSGSIPSKVWKLPNVYDFVMWGNNFTGEIPNDICFGTRNLQKLILSNNLFSGKIPVSLTKCANLSWLSLSFNQLTGTIPAAIRNLQKLSILQLSYNSFFGDIQTADLGSFPNLIWLDLSSNQFAGHIPSNLAPQTRFDPIFSSKGGYLFLRDRGRSDCRMRNSLIYSEGISEERLAESFDSNSCSSITIYSWPSHLIKRSNGTIVFLDLSFNHLSGTIPDSLGLMSDLHVLDLSHNRLTGTIPNTFGGLKEVCLLNLSYNSLQDRIPGSLGLISFLTDLDVSNNNLSGPIPSTGQLTTFPASRYENNSGLCGIPLPPCGYHPKTDPIQSDQSQNGKDHSILRNVDWIWVIAVIGYIVGVAIGVCIGNIMFQDKEEWIIDRNIHYVREVYKLGFSREFPAVQESNIFTGLVVLFVLLEGCLEFDCGM